MKNYAKIVCVLDRSGSMSSILTDAIGGFNTFLKEQKKIVNDDVISVYLFDDKHEVLYENCKIQDAKELTLENFVPRGSTALNDAIAINMNKLGKELSDMDENDRPNKVIFVVLTDGYENASIEYNGEEGTKRVRDMIEHQEEKYNWQFIYLSADKDAFLAAKNFGIKSATAFNSRSKDSVTHAYANAYMSVSNLRGMSVDDFNELSRKVKRGSSMFDEMKLEKDLTKK